MEKEKLQDNIRQLIANIIISEEVLDKTIIQLKGANYPQKYAEKLNENINSGEIRDFLFFKKAREKKYFSICYLTHQLLIEYTTEAIPCFVFHQYLFVLRCNQEKNLDWYQDNPAKIFTVKPTPELQKAETKLFAYLLTEEIKAENTLRYRHFWTTLYLFFDYVSDYDTVEKLINKFQSSTVNLQM